MGFLSKSLTQLTTYTLLLVLYIFCCGFTSTEAYIPRENITINWDVISWTPDGYVAVVTMFNYQKHRQIKAPGWRLGWTWAKKEVIWSMAGAQATEQGDCSRFRGNIPHSCKRNPTIVDLTPRVPYNQQIANCCTGGVLKSKAASVFQLSVGSAGTSNRTVKMPKNFILKAPASRYICGPTKMVRPPTKFITQDGRRMTQALMTWNATCTYHH